MSIALKGFHINIVSKIKSNLCCLLCSNILDNPYQAPCGCRFCFECISNYIDRNAKICPGKTEDCLEVKLKLDRHLRPDALAKREINKMIAKCPLYLCDQECELRKMKDHLLECSSSIMSCGKCDENITRGEYENHKESECKESIVKCEFCNHSLKRKLLKEEHYNYDHINICFQYKNYCPNECGERNKVVWKRHRTTCQKKYLECPYRTIGCNSEPLTLREMSLHISSNERNHIKGLLEELENLRNVNESLKNSIINVNNEMTLVKKKYDQQEQDLKNEINYIKSIMSDMKVSHVKTINDLQNNLRDEILSSKNGICRMEKEMEAMKNDFDAIKKEYKKVLLNQVENSIEKGANKIKRNNVEMNLRSTIVALVWKIECFSTVNFLKSPSFYTHDKGYKMEISLEKVIKGYLSIYARLCEGPYDDKLQWPFRKCVTIKIIDQENRGRDYQKIIIFDKKSGSVCDRKYSSATGGFGYTEFISYKYLRLNSYLLKYNTLSVHCYVDDNSHP